MQHVWLASRAFCEITLSTAGEAQSMFKTFEEKNVSNKDYHFMNLDPSNSPSNKSNQARTQQVPLVKRETIQ
jgi:hypothetical protein